MEYSGLIIMLSWFLSLIFIVYLHGLYLLNQLHKGGYLSEKYYKENKK